MKNTRTVLYTDRRAAGQVSPVLLGVLLLFAAGGAVVAYLAFDHFTRPDEDDGRKSTQARSEDIADELGALQQEFQTLLQENLELTRFEPRVDAFTRSYPNETDGHVLHAQVQMQMNQWESAYASWLRALEQDPESFELCKMAGFCSAKLGRLPQAEVHYRDAVRASGNTADNDVYAALGRLYLAMGDGSAAEEAFNSALEAPGAGGEMNWKHEAYSGLANVAALRGDYATAFSKVEQAIRIGNADSKADLTGYHIQKARIYMDAGRDDDAAAWLIHTWNTFPPSLYRIESARLRTKLYEEAGELDKAVNHATLVCDYHQRQPTRKNDEVAEFVALLARWQIKTHRTGAARISVDNLATLSPDHPQLEELRAALR